MPTAHQVKSLIRSHFGANEEQFTTTVLQVAAQEARKGHQELAQELRTLVDGFKDTKVKFRRLNPNLEGLILELPAEAKKSEFVAPPDLKQRLERILNEYRQRGKLKSHGLEHRRKIMLSGAAGTGKTLTAEIIAKELNLPFFVILMDKLVTKFMGETSAQLRLIFNQIEDVHGVYLFDEFDAIGSERSLVGEVAEMRRVLNSFLQFIEQNKSDSFIVTATNNVNLLDNALFRRFDDVLKYELPDIKQARQLIKNRLGTYQGKFDIENIPQKYLKLSHAEIALACNHAVKESILSDKRQITKSLLEKMLKERLASYPHHK
ncbi:MAG: SpoVK/Ycf46/Vps4 family AAA+-type ATPase [Ulvibacter sp.]|jgi:SpoVK/Ycf46/Vps4 family AAA+-type ATPase